MYPTYRAILRGHSLEWQGEISAFTHGDQSVSVHVTLLDAIAPSKQQQGAAMVAALEQLAAQNSLADIADPVAWQKEQRQDRPLPGREEHDN